MVEQKENQTTPPPEHKKPPQVKKTPSEKSHKNFIPFIAILLSLIAVVISGFATYSFNIWQEKIHNVDEHLDDEIDSLKNNNTQLMTKINQTSTLINESQQQFATKIQSTLHDLNNQMAKLSENSPLSNLDYTLLQTRYYLELAHINAFWGRDHDTTLQLLKQADKKLSDLNEQAIFPIRKALAAEIESIESLGHSDIAGMLSILDALQSTSAQLEIKKTPSSLPSSINSNEKNQWRSTFNESLEKLKKLIVIRRNKQPYILPLSPEEESLARASLIFTLQQTQWAILQADDAVYQLSLKQAEKIVTTNFDTLNRQVQQFLLALQKLTKISLAKKSVDLNESLNLLNAYIENKIPSMAASKEMSE